VAAKPIIFAMANPDPEITPEDARAARPDAIVATGRSDYPNQINNVLGFPYIFRGALDVRARTINDAMKIAAAKALAELAREDVPDEVARSYSGRKLKYGPGYLIPTPFDPRLISHVSSAVAQAAVDSGVARKPITDMRAYRRNLSARLDPTAASLQGIFEKVHAHPQRVVFAEGEEERVIRAAITFRNAGFGKPVLVGREERIQQTIQQAGLDGHDLEIHNARLSSHNAAYTDFLYARLQRKGYLYRDCQRRVNQDRNVFAACMVALGHANAMVTGTTRNFWTCYQDIARVIDPKPGERVFAVSVVVSRGRTVFMSDTYVHELPTPDELADIAIQTAAKARQMGHEPRVALLSFSNFGNPNREKSYRVRDAVEVLNRRKVDFEYDGEMSADVALDDDLRKLYPFCRLSGPANVLIMPALHTANVAYKLMQKLGGATIVGPLIIGLSKPAQIVQMGATVSDLVNTAAIAAYDAIA
jgi:malate dehydrogenase (oxaloacetate-decarboxylating)(NADP+)